MGELVVDGAGSDQRVVGERSQPSPAQRARSEPSGQARPVPPSTPLRLALVGGGTGGHMVPGLQLLSWLAGEAPGAAAISDLVWFGSGRPIDAWVRRPMTIGLPMVSALNRLRSAGRRHGKPPSRPITRSRAIATIRAHRTGIKFYTATFAGMCGWKR